MELELKNIRKTFGEKLVLDGISFKATGGSAFGLLGRNGAGKTTTIRIIMQFFDADSGDVLLDGKPIAQSGVKIGYLPEERGLYPKKKIGEQMIYFAQLRGLERAEAEKSARKWLERVELSDYYDKRLDTLSKGNQQKIQLALALINNPDIIILDEPFSGLDPVNALMLKQIINDFKGGDRIALFSSHQMAQVEEFCDDIVILNAGNIALSGNLRQIKRAYPREKIRVNADDIAGMHKLMRSDRFAELVRDTEDAYDGVTVTLRDAAMRDELLRRLIDGGTEIDGFHVVEPTLEQIFIQAAE